MLNIKNKILVLVLLATFFITYSRINFAAIPINNDENDKLNLTDQGKDKIINLIEKTPEQGVKKDEEKISQGYSPYLQFGGTRFLGVSKSNMAAKADFFLPIFQTDNSNELVYTDLRFDDRSSKPFEGNIHLGYRHLSPERQHMYGVYSAFDRKRTELGNYFNQLTFGAECWLENFFIGGNFYQPIGSTSKFIGITGIPAAELDKASGNVWITKNNKFEKAFSGVDAEVGYEFILGLVGYAGGYYFKAVDANSIVGPKARLTYDLSLNNGKMILGVFDQVGLEAGIQRDAARGTVGYISANVKIGLTENKNSNLQGVSRHMVDLVRRDVDVVSAEINKKERAFADSNKQSAKTTANDNSGTKAAIDINKENTNKKEVDITKNDKNQQQENLNNQQDKWLAVIADTNIKNTNKKEVDITKNDKNQQQENLNNQQDKWLAVIADTNIKNTNKKEDHAGDNSNTNVQANKQDIELPIINNEIKQSVKTIVLKKNNSWYERIGNFIIEGLCSYNIAYIGGSVK